MNKPRGQLDICPIYYRVGNNINFGVERMSKLFVGEKYPHGVKNWKSMTP
jgi:hypothetical protein